MPRLPRAFQPELPVHLVHRGNNRQTIFHDDSDRLAFRRFVGIAGIPTGVTIHSYVLMPNHVHLLVTSASPTGISRFVQSVARRYVGYFNERYHRTGTLWEGRFHSAIVSSDHYLFACHRYIDMNPVRAGLVRHPADYPWSSHRHYTLGAADDILTDHPVIHALGLDDQQRALAYRRMFTQSAPSSELDAIRLATQRRTALGSSAEKGV